MVAIIYTSSAQVKGRAREYGRYRNVMVLDVRYDLAWLAEQGKWSPARWDGRGVNRRLRTWGSCSVGKTDRCEYRQALKAAREFVTRYNAAGDAAEAEQIIGAGGSA